jgi:hypothetical protein
MTDDTRNNGRATDGRFTKGNPGRPLGARHKATLAAEAILDGEAEALTRKAVEKALEGDATALRLCLERILPARKDRPIAFELPKIDNVAESAKLVSALLGAVAAGDVTPGEAGEVSRLIETYVKALEATDLEGRLKALEERMAGNGKNS